jgi:hypothetical protein
VFCLVRAEHKFDFKFVVNGTLTNGKQWKVIKADIESTFMFSLQGLSGDK